jgi:hypothetical protein
MSEYGHYVTYRNTTRELREKAEEAQRAHLPRQRRRRTGREALARRLHSIADLLEG